MEYDGGLITFKGELHTIPAGAALVLKVDRHMTAAQTEALLQHCRRVLGQDQRVLVVGPEVTPMALDRLPVRSMGVDPGAGDDRTVMGARSGVVEPKGQITIINRTSAHLDPEMLVIKRMTESLTDPNSRVAKALALRREESAARGERTVCNRLSDEPKAPAEDPMEAVRALAKKHGGGSGG